MAIKKQYGLIGYPLAHSFSPAHFTDKFASEHIEDCSYQAYPLTQIHELVPLLESGVSGLNVTIPYKEAVIPYLDELTPESRAIGAVNTIAIHKGKLVGHNTDVIGFKASLLAFIGEQTLPEKALVLGTGGAAKAVIFVLQTLGIRYTNISRKAPCMTYKELTPTIMDSHQLIVNTTPLGTYPDVDTYPQILYHYLSSEHFLYDLVYNPEKTIFLKRGIAAGARVKNGYDMLIRQAEASWTIWNTTE